jgi:hypothetical protein
MVDVECGVVMCGILVADFRDVSGLVCMQMLHLDDAAMLKQTTGWPL